MEYIPLLSLLGAFFSFTIGILVLFQKPKSRLHQVFAFTAILAAYWGFIQFEVRFAFNIDGAYFWDKINLLWPFSVAGLLHFVLIYYSPKDWVSKYLIPGIVYTWAGITAYIEYALIIPIDFINKPWGWSTYIDPALTDFQKITENTGAAIGVIVVVLSIVYYLRTKNSLLKTQSRFVTIGIFTTILAGAVTEVIIERVVPGDFPGLGPLSFAVGLIPIGYAIINYGLFELSAERAYLATMNTISDALFLINNERQIYTVNKAALNILGTTKESLLKRGLGTVIEFTDAKTAEKVLKEDTVTDVTANLITHKKGKIPISLSSAIVYSKEGTKEGVIILARDISERLNAQEEALGMSKKLEQKNDELQRMNQLMIGRELRMAELKKELEKNKNKK